MSKMGQRAWLLVEWKFENSMFPTYEVVNIDTSAYSESDLQPGKKIILSTKRYPNHEQRRAKVLRISDNKNQILEQKEYLENQDERVKNMMEFCMRTIKQVKSQQFAGSTSTNTSFNTSRSNQPVGLLHIYTETSDDSASEDDSTNAVNHYTRQNITITQHLKQPNNQRDQSTSTCDRTVPSPRCRSVVSSTPIPRNHAKKPVKLSYDQGTQTDSWLSRPPIEKIQEMEIVIQQLYKRYRSLVKKVSYYSSSIKTEPSDQENNDVSFNEPNENEYWADQNRTAEGEANNEQNDTNDIGEEIEDIESNNGQVNPTENGKSNGADSSTRVRRMSAQTTNSVDMVPIGDGNAMVPARLLTDIDWNSYTTATRQLLQAIFSRKVLATHSLTGKQSPAHSNKPAKKILDPLLVNDIVKTVSLRCGVPPNLVRNSITVKCTDEAKLYRNRQQSRQMRADTNRQNEENTPSPPTPHSDE